MGTFPSIGQTDSACGGTDKCHQPRAEQALQVNDQIELLSPQIVEKVQVTPQTTVSVEFDTRGNVRLAVQKRCVIPVDNPEDLGIRKAAP
jgi:hypothetical protein